MKWHTKQKRLLWGALAVNLWFSLLAAETTGPSISPEALEDARAELHRAVQAGEIAGGLLWVAQEGKVILEEAAGVCDIEDRIPFRTNTIVRIYSMTKPIVSVAAMRLYEAGKFQLDDPVARYIPAFAHVRVLERHEGEIRLVPPKRPITVRDLFRHTSGYSYGDGWEKKWYAKVGMRYHGPGEMFPPEMTLAEAAEAMTHIPLLHHPGERFTYGFSVDLLGRLIEIWSGQRLDEYLREAIFQPLDMPDTGFMVPPDRANRFASCHTRRDGKIVILDKRTTSPYLKGFRFLSGGGGLVSTAQDYGHFCQMLLNGGTFRGRRLLRKQTLQLMFIDQLGGVAGKFRFGLGFAIGEVEVGKGRTRRQVPVYYWGGYASTEFRILPTEKLALIFLRQMIPTDNRLANDLFRRIYAGVR